MARDPYSEEIIAKINAYPLQKYLSHYISTEGGSVVFWAFSHITVELVRAKILIPIFGESAKNREDAQKDEVCLCLCEQLRAVRNTKKERSIVVANMHGIIYPLVQGERCYGTFLVFGLSNALEERIVPLLGIYLTAAIRDVQKDIELTKLFETIRPRAIALSTIHTVHRLINSTLDIDELLPRIARLCMQVVRANRCSIKLLDKKTKTLMPKATIDLRIDGIRPKKLKVGKGIPGKAVELNKVLRGDNYLSTPLYDEDIIGVVTVYDKIDKRSFSFFDQEIMTTLSEQAVVAIKNAQLYKRQEEITVGSIKALAALLDSKIGETYRPKESFVKISVAMCKMLGMDYEQTKSIKYAAMLHAADKVLVPETILNKEKKLSKKEISIIRQQPTKSVDIIKHLRHLGPISEIILHKHENYDGTGYPRGLKGKEIPLGSRILLIVDAFIAMCIQRPYRVKRTFDEAIEELKGRRDTQFDPDLVDVFLKVIKDKRVLECLKFEGYLDPEI